MTVQVERARYGQFGQCVRIFNEAAELYVTTDFGPRIIHYSLLGGCNCLFTNEQRINIKRGSNFDETFYPGAYWNIYGGNRLWVSPEVMPDTFYPDHDPVDYELLPNGAAFRCRPQIHNLVQLTTEVNLDEWSGKVSLKYFVKNTSEKQRVMAAWSVTAMAPGGIEIVPQPTVKKGVLPNRLISLWDYSDMTDERMYWGKNYIVLKHDPVVEKPIKLGINNIDGWACYLNKETAFICRYEHDLQGTYADFGVSYETFAIGGYLEMESMAPLKVIDAGQVAAHKEWWDIFPIERVPNPKCENEITAFADKYIKR